MCKASNIEMEVVSGADQKEGMMDRGWGKLKAFPGKLKKLGKDDPRRIIHSLKVGLAITLVSLFYYFEPLYEGFGVSAMWAVMTVVVVFEFSVGATLSKGLNRGLATIVAGTLGFGAHCLADLPGERGEPIILGLLVFLQASMMTFIRFFPQMKAKYDYGLLVFILTFCLISVSGYRNDEVLDMAYQRVSTILIGGFTAMLVCIFICPIWAGHDLHNLVSNNIEQLACFLEGFGLEYFKTSEDEESNKTLSEGYKSVLHSKQTEESLTPQEIHSKIQEESIRVSSESVKGLKELAMAIKTMTTPSAAILHITRSKIAAKNLKFMLNTELCKEISDLLEVIPAVTMASLLADVVSCSEKIAESVHELASLAKFKSMKPELVAERKPSLRNAECVHEVASVDKFKDVKPEVAAMKPSLRKMQSYSSINVHQSHHVITVE
ncbi:hypothetical protein LWI28_004916 [Acer negundo]|uniref:Aluminum-activated malate transporter n=1 Tax=Acer negundo TaxID=4023 RepID=A0AAD5JCR6_ACENE|nr:hypothetical protein LWI28_004916 [Acer negundo]